MRKPRLTGIYYPAAQTLIDKQLIEAFTSEKGPGDIPVAPSNKKEHVKGIIVPMYPYDLAAPCAGWAYKALSETNVPDVVIILGQSKTEDDGFTIDPYETPYGIVRVDQALAREIEKKTELKQRDAIFDEDDTIESQLPLLQFVYKQAKTPLKILPILVSHKTELKKLAVDIKEILMETGKKAAIVVPTNFTSYGRNYNYIPFSEDAHKKVYELDKEALDLISANKPLDYLKYADEHMMNTQNYLGITLALLILKPKTVLLEQYYTTADLNQDYKNFISFAAVVMK